MDVVDILGVPIAAVDPALAVARIDRWVRRGRRTYVTVTGVHGIMESQRNPEIKRIHRRAGMCVPDGMPTVWIGRMRGHRRMRRVYGPDLMLRVCEMSVRRGYTHFLYGGKPGVAEDLEKRLCARFPGLRVVGTFSPPFRPLTAEEERDLRRLIDRLAPDLLWVGLSTPKQERWMAEHVGRLNVKVMIGVGAAFDFHTGRLPQAPPLVQQAGLEWLYRLLVEPRRLWRRYLVNNTAFICRMVGQMLGLRRNAFRPCPGRGGLS